MGDESGAVGDTSGPADQKGAAGVGSGVIRIKSVGRGIRRGIDVSLVGDNNVEQQVAVGRVVEIRCGSVKREGRKASRLTGGPIQPVSEPPSSARHSSPADPREARPPG